MAFQLILKCGPCVTFNRSFNIINKLHANHIDKFKYFCKRNYNDQSIFNLNTNVSKDVLLFKSSNDRTYKMISIFSLVQFGFWLTVADSYNVLLNQEQNENKTSLSISWIDKLKLKGKIVTLGIPIACLCMGKTIYSCI